MDDRKLVRMANQIAEFFEAWPDADAAAAEVASHLRRYWTPAMRNRLIERIKAGDDNARSSVRRAVAQLAPGG